MEIHVQQGASGVGRDEQIDPVRQAFTKLRKGSDTARSGHKFCAPDIEVMPGVYRPEADSHLLAETFAADDLPAPCEVLDLCCGSGFVGISAAMRGHHVDAVDFERLPIINARRNALLNMVQMRVLRSDLFDVVQDRRYDAILANPPYVPTPEADCETFAWCDGGPDGRVVIDRICNEAESHLEVGGSLWMVHSSLANIERSRELLTAAGLVVTEAAERLEPFGPITVERLPYLQSLELVDSTATCERLVVLKATREF